MCYKTLKSMAVVVFSLFLVFTVVPAMNAQAQRSGDEEEIGEEQPRAGSEAKPVAEPAAIEAEPDEEAETEAEKPGQQRERPATVRERPERGAPRAAPQARGAGRDRYSVAGLWAYATFGAKLDAAALAKLKPVCQKAYDAQAELLSDETLDRAARSERLRQIGETMVAEAKTALGDEAGKLQPWLEREGRGPRPARARPTVERPAARRGPGEAPKQEGAAPKPKKPAAETERAEEEDRDER